ncbi:probable ubiquitin carboxyl-terminal hydrolase FAF-X [Hydractinia symbiolongicarpus]|uniref:probable ubiquitin carboxyl-terminal hydrolase FAF-X n=1 Tax=Hydractinia symbiolongicarpus TaxID=13093 RepID=UPI00254ED243|nr:probable ubiquitin carboxyl-terminal hydrolase FAF-X [Hydractinia symbiolongicarpus]
MTVNPRTTPAGSGMNSKQDESKQDSEQNEDKNSEDVDMQKTSGGLDDVEELLDNLNLEGEVESDETRITDADYDENGIPVFPHELLAKLDEMVNKPKWIIPVLPKAELELLMDASIKLAKKGLDTQSEACQRFIKEGMTISYNKILLDDAVSTWKFEIHKYILRNTEKLLELCVVKLEQDWFPLLDLLAIALNPSSRFHLYNAGRTPESSPTTGMEERPVFARPSDPRQPKGWVVDLVNRFGNLGGFDKLKKRFCEMGHLNVPIICALIKPFGLCAEVLAEKVVEEYLLPIVHIIKKFLDSLTDEVLKKESKTESKNEAITVIIKSMKSIVARLPGQEDFCKELEKLRLLMILRLLQVSPFNGKMNALNEINRVISSVSYYSHHRHSGYDEDEYLTHDMVAKWLQENDVLVTVLKDNLHQPQYVEKLEKIIRFTIKAKTLTLQDLDTIWLAQVGKHEAIVKNIHDLLAKLAWDFSAEQLDHLFSRFQASWKSANKKQQEKLLELIRRLAEDDKEGVIAHKVLGLLWQLAHSDDLPTDIMDQALNAHIKILDYSCSQTQDRDNLKIGWITHCVDDLREGVWVIPALKQIRAICELFYEGSGQSSNPHVLYRNAVVENIQNKHAVVSLVAENLAKYMDKIREIHKNDPTIDPVNLIPDGRYSHVMQIQERLDFLRFVLNDGKMWLCEPQAEQIWICLAINCAFAVDRDVCFKWFSKVMGDDPDLDPEITKQFFENNVLKISPANLNEHGLRCFERFFKYVNMKEGLLQKKRNGTYILENVNLIGYDYLWKVIIESPLNIANHGIEILKEVYTNFGIHLRTKQSDIHSIFISNCRERLQPSEKVLINSNPDKEDTRSAVWQEAKKIMLCLKTLREYVAASDNNYGEERALPPHNRSCRADQVCLYIRFTPQNRQFEDFELWTHTNEPLALIRRQIHSRLKMSAQTVRLDIYNNGELISPINDRKLVGELQIKDRTVFTIKLGSIGGSVPSSPDSSSDSSPPPTPQPCDGPNIEAEQLLPGVILSKTKFAQVLFSLGELATKFKAPELRDIILSLLNICPSDIETINQIKLVCHERAIKGKQASQSLEKFFLSQSPIQVLYNLEVIYALLLPATDLTDHSALSFQQEFVLAGGVDCILKMFTGNNFLQGADGLIKRSSYTVLLKISKFLFTAIGYAHITVVVEGLQKDAGKITQAQHSYAVVLQQAIQHIPNTYYEYVLRSLAGKLGQILATKAIAHMPDIHVVRVIQRICWVSAVGHISLLQSDITDIHRHYENGNNMPVNLEDITLAKEAFEVLTIALALCPTILELLIRDRTWHLFIIDVLLLCKNRPLRLTAAEQCFQIASRCCSGDKPLKFFIQLLFTVRDNKVLDHPHQSAEYFNLLCRLLNYGRSVDLQLQNATKILEQEIKWIRLVQHKYRKTPDSESAVVEHELLEGHLGITKELLAYHSIQKRYSIGCEDGGDKLLVSLINDFIFSASKLEVISRTGGDVCNQHINPVCNTPPSIVAALDLLVALSTNCVQNLRLLADSLAELYYSGYDGILAEWEYQPPIGPRPVKGFVGLKNAGATCYMNSVLQQLYMIPEIGSGVLSADVGYKDEDEEGDQEKGVKEISDIKEDQATSGDCKELTEKKKQHERQLYNTKIMTQVQAIFGHLYGSKLQFYIPKGFWKSFRLWGEPVNLREQHDAYEFFNTLVDNIDEGLKSAGYKTSCSNVLGGSFADQKICKQCPHRYSRETPFTALNVDVRNHHNLIDSLEQYVKGDLLEGANAYHCERCDKKVDTVKRMCIKKLPKVLAIQLKRFDYDWERDCAVKFNDYFEFPREFNLEPFTVEGLARVEGEVIEDDVTDTITTKNKDVKEEDSEPKSTIYRLMGVVVHSGQASGGHYYSYIKPRNKVDGQHKWYKFDDGDVCECNMDDDEELKNQCFGGEYMGEVFDHMIKRRQKRWWNAYLLFYERIDILCQTDRENTFTNGSIQMLPAIKRSVRKENIQFLHTRTQFSNEYFQFMRKLTLASLMQQQVSNKPHDPVREELCLISLQLLSKFLFSVGFHTKKSIRGPANEWYEAVSVLVRQGISLRRWFVIDVLLAHPDRIIEYLLECPVAEIRSAFGRIIVLLAHLTRADGQFSVELLSTPLEQWQVKGCELTKSTLSDYLLRTVLEVLHREGPDNNTRHLLQYFQLFSMYAGIGVPERKQLLDLGVLLTFIRLAIEDDRTKYQFAELSKLYSLVSVLIRSCDVTKYMKSSQEGMPSKPNPFFDSIITTPIMEIPADVEGLIYTSNYVKKLLEESNTSEDTIHLMKFLSWECLNFSLIALSEVLFQISYAYTYELRPFLDILLHLLLMNDSWQEHRLKYAFKGVSDDREGLFDTIQRSKSHSHKRGYQCIKAIVQLTQNCDVALQMLIHQDDLKEKWKSAVRWLGDELERRAPSAYNYNNWSPPTQSNETSNGYFLERSHSARFTYAKACETFDEDEEEEEENELMESLDQSNGNIPIMNERPTLGVHYATQDDTVKCPPYSEVVMNNPVSPIDLSSTENEQVDSSLIEEDSDNQAE